MKMNSLTVYIALVVVLIWGLIYVRGVSTPQIAEEMLTPYDTFAQCLSDAGTKFYGTFWCPHCQRTD